ncbi:MULTISPECIES: phage major capsid protein, P2 family [Symbiopectobacterium]|uniref:phage major capsid protein, P2 family n=1 Tax=Symbiopectobacterium TaxID=801 RepID=UPI001A34B9C0|nr:MULTISPECIES: phage major capsid protein, P2 family [Symbiopectobacterium]MBG6247335.1 phage major capsid protein, P2 family [Candidatus Symbiopectobacterium sp. PLON1]MBT9429507.1 phage major capsid protein, P2 family [Candidatus Symbiopectobacterium endolongispinus]
MENTTRKLYNEYRARQAQLNGVQPGDLAATFSVEPSVQQRLEKAAMESDDFLKHINVFGVKAQEGQKILIGSKGPIANTNTNSDGTSRRNPVDNHSKEPSKYHCRQINYDSAVSYAQLDAWSQQPNFQALISQANARQIGLDRIMIGFNGTTYAEKSDREAHPLLQDCGIGWLQKIRSEANHRIIKNVTLTSRDEDNKVIAKGTYGNIDTAIFDAKNTLLDSRHCKAPDLVVVMASGLLTASNFPKLNALSQSNPNTELLAGQLIVSQERVGGLPTFLAPYFPSNGVLITSFKNLSLYHQLGGLRCSMVEESHYNRIATYQSSNDAFVVEDYGKVAFIDGIQFAKATVEGASEAKAAGAGE